jgi:PAS domain S-box-containing protein
MATAKQGFAYIIDPAIIISSSPKKNRSAKDLLEKVAEHVPSLIAVYNIHSGKYLFVNSSITKILGYTKNDFLAGGLEFVTDLVHPDDLEEVMNKNVKALERVNQAKAEDNDFDPIVNFEYRMRHKDGTWRWLHTDGVVFERDENGKVESVMNISIDITKRKEAELKEIANREIAEKVIKQNEMKFKALLDHSTDAVLLLDADGRRLYITPSRRNVLGFNNDKEAGNNVFEIIHPDDRPQALEAFGKVKEKPGKSISLTFRAKHKNGKWIWLEATATNLLEVPEVGAIVINYRDVTERKEQEEQSKFLEKATDLLISSLDYKTTIDNITNLIVPYMADYCRVVVLENSETKALSQNHVDPSKMGLVEKLYKQYYEIPKSSYGMGKILRTGQPELISHLDLDRYKVLKKYPQLVKTLETLKIKSYMGVPLKARGKIIGAITFSSTKDDFAYTKKNLEFAQKLAYPIALALDNARLFAVEQDAVRLRDNFISIASHELKTPIASIKGFIQIAQSQAFNKKSRYYLTRLDDQVIRLTGLINNLLDVSKIQRGKLDLNIESIFLNKLLSEAVDDVRAMGTDHEIVIKSPKNIKTWVDRYRIEQVLVNLLTNAIKYSPRAKKVFVKVLVTNHTVRIRIQDFGIGINQKNFPKIFEPFYQVDTKVRQSFGGLGLGLHISREIARRHGGDILVSSKKGIGSTFTVVLPLSDSQD